MTDIIALTKRREYIRSLLDSGVEISNGDARDIARMWNSSHVAVLNDISTIQTGSARYEKYLTTGQNTRARKFSADGILVEDEWQSILDKFGNKCAICGAEGKLTIDHIVPLSVGGSNTIDNIQPLCRSCNSRKGNGGQGKKRGRPRKQ